MSNIWDSLKLVDQCIYIKLGSNGGLFDVCKSSNVVSIGYGLNDTELGALFQAGDLDTLKVRIDAVTPNKGSAGQRFGSIRRAYAAQGKVTLWITFEGGCLWWAVSSDQAKWRNTSIDGQELELIDQWRNTNIHDLKLTTSLLPGSLTKTIGYRGTICDIELRLVDYLKDSLCGINTGLRAELEVANRHFIGLLEKVIQDLHWKDFELLVSLIFNAAGYRQVSITGGTLKGIDLELENPLTRQRVAVQVKSQLNQSILTDVIEGFYGLVDSDFDIFYFAYHKDTGLAKEQNLETLKQELGMEIVLLGGYKLAEMALQYGFSDWLVRKSV